MGSWGAGILQDDTVLDVIEEFKRFLKVTQSIKESTIKIIESNKELIEDADDGPLFWIALAKCQWDYGTLDNEVLNHVKDDFLHENGLDLWKEEGEKLYLKRKKTISSFIEKLETPNPKVKKLPKLTIRKPLFEVGDCLSLKVNDEYYGAALVVRSDHSNLEYGCNLIAALRYWSKTPPYLNNFRDMDFLSLTLEKWKGELHMAWYFPIGFGEYTNRIANIGNIDVSRLNDINSTSLADWSSLFKRIELQYQQ